MIPRPRRYPMAPIRRVQVAAPEVLPWLEPITWPGEPWPYIERPEPLPSGLANWCWPVTTRL